MRIHLSTFREFVWLFAATTVVWAQGSVHGKVTDPLGGVISGARVMLDRGSEITGETKTGPTGDFEFSSLSAARYHLRVETPGFSSFKGEDVFVGSSGVTKINAVLEISPLQSELVVSDTGFELPASQVGASVYLINPQDIKGQNKLDVLENLRQVTGTQVVQTSQRGSSTSLYIRGGESSFNKVLIDGIPSNALGGGFDFAQLSNTGVDSIEVLKSANSVLYGADGLAGVVNITSQRGTSTIPVLSYSVDGGNFGTLRELVSLGGAFRKFDYFSEFSRFDTRGSFPNDYFHNATYAGNFGWRPNSQTDVRVTYRRNWTDLGSPNALLLYEIPDDASQRNQNTYLSGTVENQTTDRWHNLFRFAFAQFGSTFFNPSPTGEPDAYGFGNYLGNVVTVKGANGYSVTGQGILDYGGFYPQVYPSYEARRSAYGQSDYRAFGDWTGTFGFRYEHEDGSGFVRDNYSYFLEAHGSVRHRLYLTGGVGFEDNAVFKFAASPRASAAYYLRKPRSGSFFADTKLNFNFGEGIKEPSTYQQGNQLFALLTPAQQTQFGVSAIGPERSTVFDFGVSQGILNGRSRLEASFFRNRFYDLISYLNPIQLEAIGVDPGAALASGYGAYVNASSTKAQGFEIQSTTEVSRGLRIQASYTKLDAVVTKAFGSPVYNPAFPEIAIGAFAPLQGQRPFRRAPNSGTISVLYGHRKFSGALTGYIVGRRDDSTFLTDAFYGNSLLLPNRNLAPSYQKVDLAGRYALKPYLSLYTSMENLLSQHYQAAFGFPAAPFTIRAGLTLTLGGENWRK